jgi:hypothetical protein
MIHIIDASEGRFDAGRFPEAEALGALALDAKPEIAGLGPRSDALHGLCELAKIYEPRFGSRALTPTQRLESQGLCAWSRHCARWALTQSPGMNLSVRLLEGPTGTTRETVRWVPLLSQFRQIVVEDQTDADAWARCGLPGARLETRPTELDPLQTKPSRESLRLELEVETDELLVMPLAAPWSSLDAQHVIFLLGMLRVNGWKVSALVPASAWRLEGARRFARRAAVGARLIVIDGPMTPWMSACDAVFLDAARPRDTLATFVPRGALRMMMAAARRVGVPVAVTPGSLLEAVPTPAPSVADELSPLMATLEPRRTEVESPAEISV